MSFTQGTIRWRGSPRPALPARLEPVAALDDVVASIASVRRGAPIPLLMRGVVGCGKTTLMAEIDLWLRTKIRRPRVTRAYQAWLDDEPTWWTTADEYLDDVKAGWAYERKYPGDWTPDYSADGIASQVRYLFLDDVGAERDAEFARSAIDGLLRDRHVRRLPTWITTNLDADAIYQRYGERLLSRLMETHVLVTVEGGDRRLAGQERVRARLEGVA